MTNAFIGFQFGKTLKILGNQWYWSYEYPDNGNFTFDANNTLVNASTGLKVQGTIADNEGNFASGAISDIQIDPSTVVPAQATTNIQVFGNLSSESDAVGTHMLQTGPMLATATGTDDLRFLHTGADGSDLVLTTGDVIAMQGSVNGTSISSAQFEVGDPPPAGNQDGTTLDDLTTWMSNELSTLAGGPVNVSLQADGTVLLDNQSGVELQDIKLSAGGRVAFNQVMLFGNSIPAGSSTNSAASLLSPAQTTDVLSDIYNSDGDRLNFQFSGGDTTMEIGGTLGGSAITPTTFTVTDGVTTVAELMTHLTTAFRISNSQGITLSDEGRLDVQGDVGLANGINNISLRESDNLLSNVGTSIDFGVIDEAKDADTFSVTNTVYDSLGRVHNLTMDFTKRTGLNIWDWQASLDGDEQISAGENGTVTFDEDGRLVSFLYTDGGGQISFRPQAAGDQGAAQVNVTIDPGVIGGVNGLTQYSQRDQVQAVADGYGTGRLVDFDIDRRGVVTGRFSNDTVRDLARISMARFNNPSGLVRSGNNAFSVSGNSGQPIYSFATEGGMGSLSNGALEASNVDLSEQFTRMVVGQRAFQSNARVIKTSDEVLQELVNIV